MKKVINENTIKQIVRETLTNLLREDSWDNSELSSDEKWQDVEDDFFSTNDTDDYEYYDEDHIHDTYGNGNVKDTNGVLSMAAQGHPDAMSTRIARNGKLFNSQNKDTMFDDEFNNMSKDIDWQATKDEADFLNDRMVKEAVNKALNKYLKEDKDSDMADMYDKYGNNNVHDTKGRESMWSQGKEEDMATHVGRATRSTGADSVNAAKKDKFFGLKEDKDSEMADMYDKHGNNNVHDTKGRESMWSQGKKGEMATHIGRATRSTGAESVKAAKKDKFFSNKKKK